MRLPRWSTLRLRTKGLVVVTLPVLPLAFFWLLVGLAVLRQSTPAGTRVATSVQPRPAASPSDRVEQNRQRSQMWLIGFLAGSVVCGGGGFAAALMLGNGIRRRIEILTHNAGQIARHGTLEPLPAGDDEISRLGERLTEADRLLRRREEDLRQTSASLDRFFHLSQDLFCIAGFDGSFKRLNGVWFTTLGFTTEELMSKPFIEWVHPDDRESTVTVVGRLLDGVAVVDFENRYRTRDGSYRWLLWSARAQTDEGLIYASARDVTEQRAARQRMGELHADLSARTEQLEAANHELEAFSYSVSHDLRAPLRAIDGFSQAIEEDQADRLDASGRDALRRVRAAATRMGTLIDELLQLARLTRMEITREPVDLGHLAEGIVGDLAQRGSSRRVDVAIAPHLLANGDTRMLRVAMENLIGNAWKYTSKTSAARIEVGRSQNGDVPVYHVRDNGAGFDMAYADKLFGAFQRLHTDRDFEGTGIGLATVRRIVHRHGGRIWAEGAVGAGATFYFTLEPGATEHV